VTCLYLYAMDFCSTPFSDNIRHKEPTLASSKTLREQLAIRPFTCSYNWIGRELADSVEVFTLPEDRDCLGCLDVSQFVERTSDGRVGFVLSR